MRRPRRGAVVRTAVAAGALGASTARGDLDVGVPPGTPLDWVAGLPRRIPTGAVRIPTGLGGATEKPAAAEGRTVARVAEAPEPPVVASDVGATTPLGYARILTPDIVSHMTWVTSDGGGAAPPPKADPNAPGKAVPR